MNTSPNSKILLALLLIISIQFTLAQASEDELNLGGAFRYTYMFNSWDNTHEDICGRAIFDVLILNAHGQIKGIDFSIETRYYAPSFGGFMLRNGYVGLPLSDNLKLKLGMPRTPFGILPFTGNSFMFNMQYYLGFEDDADMGAVLEYSKEKFEAQLSFAKNSEDIFSQSNNRYAYDISGNNQEINQFTGRIAYHINNDKWQSEVGISGQYGGIYNTQSFGIGNRKAAALHAVVKRGTWNLKTEIMPYDFSPQDSLLINTIEMGAFAADYQVASQGISYSISLSYTFEVNHLLLNDIKFYNDFSALEKTNSNFNASYMNVTGFMIHTGPIYMLVDYVIAKNHPWMGTNYSQALSNGGDTEWQHRFNVNLGIYF